MKQAFARLWTNSDNRERLDTLTTILMIVLFASFWAACVYVLSSSFSG